MQEKHILILSAKLSVNCTVHHQGKDAEKGDFKIVHAVVKTIRKPSHHMSPLTIVILKPRWLTVDTR